MHEENLAQSGGHNNKERAVKGTTLLHIYIPSIAQPGEPCQSLNRPANRREKEDSSIQRHMP
jgi:hypothetical protein